MTLHSINADKQQVLRILVIDDDQVDRMTVIRSLQKAGIKNQTDTAATGATGLELLHEQQYDCIFIDFKLPDTNGLELLKKIRAIGILTPVLIITSHGDESDAEEAIRSGASDYIPKTLLSPDGIALSLRNALRFHHVNQEKKLAELNLKISQTQLNTILSAAPLALWGIDNIGIITYAQGLCFNLIGIKASALVGKSVFDVFGSQPSVIQHIKRALSGEVVRKTIALDDYYFESHYIPVYEQNRRHIIGVTGVFFDISDRINAEKELLHAKELAELSVKTKEKFIANISHEIRTPMNGIMGLSKVLQNTPLAADQRKYLKAIQTSADNLLVIINDLLDFSKIQAQKVTFEKIDFNIREKVQEIVQLMESKVFEKNNALLIDISATVPQRLIGDPHKLTQILLNLIGNACKFTANGKIELEADLLSETETVVWLEFIVKDTGIGIAPEKLEFIFESFSQASNDTTRKYGGTGLGLTISKNLVELQGGKLSVESTPGKGSAFTFMLPFTKINPEETGTSLNTENLEERVEKLTELRVLVAEDNPINQLLTEKLLSDWGFLVDLAENGQEALEQIKQKPVYDLILMDVQMPEMDGYEATRSIRRLTDERAGVPVIALTAHATPEELEKSIEAGANAYVSKPFEPEELLQKITMVVKRFK